MAKKEYAFYPGCSSQLKASASNYLTSVNSMCKTLDVKLTLGHYFKDGVVSGIKTGLTMKAVALGLLKTKRLNPLEIVGGHRIKDVKGFHAIIAKAREIEDRRRGLKG